MKLEVTVRGVLMTFYGSPGPRYSREEYRRRANEIYLKIKKQVDPDNKGKILAIDIESGEYEVDEDDVKATDRLYMRLSDPQIFCFRIGYKSVHSLAGSIAEIES